MNNLNISLSKNQVNNLTVNQLINQLVNDCSQWAEKSRSKIVIFNEIMKFFVWYGPKTMPSQTCIAQRTGYTREWVNKVIKEFFDNGWLHKEGRHRKPCIYRINRFFMDQDVSWSLKDYFPALKMIKKFKLPTWLKPQSTTQFTPSKSKDLYLNTNTFSSSNFDKKGGRNVEQKQEDPNFTRKLIDLDIERTRSEQRIIMEWDALAEVPLVDRIPLLENLCKKYPSDYRKLRLAKLKEILAKQQTRESELYVFVY